MDPLIKSQRRAGPFEPQAMAVEFRPGANTEICAQIVAPGGGFLTRVGMLEQNSNSSLPFCYPNSVALPAMDQNSAGHLSKILAENSVLTSIGQNMK